MFEAFAPWLSLGGAALFVQERRSQSSWQIFYRRAGEKLAKEPGETKINKSDLDPNRDFVIVPGL